ncbi:hypothetical protein ICA16_05875 [Pseudomonas anatoliensis]|uniref:hypothetical protein n=1 Tax=Pseudomonas anatoliensis TaxID=2710589 RepID=UPI001B3275AF|nr:hypothetical protein [Pseudomonas anatoliensis]MBP5955185.1 hypothetical protein [Pseudomonas anatoliensis]
MLKIIWNIIAGAAVLSGLYQGYATYKVPKAEVSLAYSVSDFNFPPSLTSVFDESGDRKLLEASYSDVVKYSGINSIAYAGLHNEGNKSAADIRVTFPTARLITVEPERSKAYEIRDGANVIIEKLAPGESVYIRAWLNDSAEKALDKISSVHSEGAVELSPLTEVPKSSLTKNDTAFYGMFAIAVMLLLLAIFLAYNLYWTHEDPKASSSRA